MKSKKTLKEVFDSFPTRAFPCEFHNRDFEKKNSKVRKHFKKMYGVDPEPRLYFPILINWSEKGRGFGEYAIWAEGDKIYIDNECDSKETVKRIFCAMIDNAYLTDEPGRDTKMSNLLKKKGWKWVYRGGFWRDPLTKKKYYVSEAYEIELSRKKG